MDQAFWARAHGATTHFPIALVLCSLVLDAAGAVLWRRPVGRSLAEAGYWTIVLAALGTGPAVLSGLCMTRGSLFGHGLLRMHHLAVWPSLALIAGLGAWRAARGREEARRLPVAYLVLVAATAALVGLAAAWGGELMMAQTTA